MTELMPQVKELIDKCNRIAMLPHRFNKRNIITLLKRFYKIYNLEFPSKIRVRKDIFDGNIIEICEVWSSQASQAWQASQASQAWQAWQASQASQARQACQASTDYFEYELIFDFTYSLENKINEYDKKFIEGQSVILDAKEQGLGFFFDDGNGTIYLIPCCIVKLNTRNQYHSDTTPSIEWKGGYKLFYLNDVIFPEKLWKKVVSKNMPFEEVLKIADIDQRTQAMKYSSVEKFLEYSKAEVVDKYTKYTPDKTEVRYWLYKIPKGDIFTKDVCYMAYEDPSTFELYMSGVPDFKSVAEAMAWKCSDDEFIMTADDWKNMMPLIHES